MQANALNKFERWKPCDEWSYSDIYNYLYIYKRNKRKSIAWLYSEIVTPFMMNALEDDGRSPGKRCVLLRRTIKHMEMLLNSSMFDSSSIFDHNHPLPIRLLLGRLKTRLHALEAAAVSSINRSGGDYIYKPPLVGFPRIMQEAVNDTLNAFHGGRCDDAPPVGSVLAVAF